MEERMGCLSFFIDALRYTFYTRNKMDMQLDIEEKRQNKHEVQLQRIDY